MTLWLDVEDLFHYAAGNSRPSGIQRLSFEIYAELHAMLGDGVRFCRHDPASQTLRTVPWEVLRALFVKLLIHEPQTPSMLKVRPGSGLRLEPRKRGALRRMTRHLPLEIRHSLAQAAAAQRTVLSHGLQALRVVPSLLRAPRGTAAVGQTSMPEPAALPGEDIRDAARAGDILGVFGSPWFHTDYARFIGRLTESRSMRIALLVYDIIPLMRPEWCDSGLVRIFREWFAAFAPRADMLFAISEASARDVERWAARTCSGIALPIRILPIGTGFSSFMPDDVMPKAAPALPAGLLPNSYVLVVSTIEARKNHLLAFRVWRRMVEEMPAEDVPTLVFAGRIGWLVADLMQQLENCAYLDGKIVVVAEAADADLAALYRGCRFTLFPSLYEGWGLPVTESLSFGKLCVASDRTSIPEAGGPFCLYLDPENIPAATEVIRQACTDDALIAACEARIRESFHPTPWRATALSLLRHLKIQQPFIAMSS